MAQDRAILTTADE